LDEKLGPASGKNKDFGSGQSAALSLEIAEFTLNFALSLLGTRGRRRQTQIEIARFQRVFVVA
jgi:hypothetical protein